MKILLNKTVETKEEVEIEVPFFADAEYKGCLMVTEDKVIKVSSEDQITIIQKNSNPSWFERELTTALEANKITEVEFLEKLFATQSAISEACGVSDIPTIFTQTEKI